VSDRCGQAPGLALAKHFHIRSDANAARTGWTPAASATVLSVDAVEPRLRRRALRIDTRAGGLQER